ncbi:TonB-dependent receptor [candidate division KSB1 bacterium]|nr:TonB-dependent receptor [candidate division KSB1 bacterium]
MKILRCLLVLLFVGTLASAKEKALISGLILDETGAPLPYANIIIQENNRGTTSNLEGKFEISLEPGPYTVLVKFIGYETSKAQVQLRAGETVQRKFVLKSTAIQLGQITVIAPQEFIPLDPETKSVIHSGEIEHIQASSLGDVMQLLPGEKTTNPNLHYPASAEIRGGTSLGTQLILDEVPVSNNVNMQVGIGYTSGVSGADLRAIPAENIQEVEIIRGIPSAQYGDLVDGIMKVKTKSKPEPFRAKIKYNPHLYEANVSRGVTLSQWIINGNFNMALSERDVRVEDDGYTRFAGQLSARKEAALYDIKNSLYFTTAIDESKEKPGYALREAWYNRDYNFKYSGKALYRLSALSNISGTFSVSYTHQNSYLQQLVSRDNLVLSDRMNEGAQEGVIVFGTYLGKKWIKGDAWDLFADLSTRRQFGTPSFFHTMLAGFTWRNDFNKGDGLVFDPLYPPILGTQAIRLRRYADLPAYQTLSFYAEDKITGRLLKPFTLQAGFRYEAYRPTGMNFSGLWRGGDFIESHNGTFLNPRLNFSVNLFEDTQLRTGYGATSKSPPLGMLYPGIAYFDIVDTVAVVDPLQPEQNFSIISTYLRDRSNKTLKGYSQTKYEISLDQQAGPLGFTLTGFWNDTKDMFNSVSFPLILSKNAFPAWPHLEGAWAKDTLFYDFNRYENNGWLKSRGVELSFKTRRLPVIHTVISLDAAYQETENGINSLISSSIRYSPELEMDVIPFYTRHENYDKKLLFNYRFYIQVQTLGIWVTLHVQHSINEIDGRRGLADTLAQAYFSEKGEMIFIDEAQRGDEKYIRLRRSYRPYELLEEDPPNLLLFNVKVSKSLWKGAEVSFFVNNFFNHRPLYLRQRSAPNMPEYIRRNPELFFGLEFSSTFPNF